VVVLVVVVVVVRMADLRGREGKAATISYYD